MEEVLFSIFRYISGKVDQIIFINLLLHLDLQSKITSYKIMSVSCHTEKTFSQFCASHTLINTWTIFIKLQQPFLYKQKECLLKLNVVCLLHILFLVCYWHGALTFPCFILVSCAQNLFYYNWSNSEAWGAITSLGIQKMLISFWWLRLNWPPLHLTSTWSHFPLGHKWIQPV